MRSRNRLAGVSWLVVLCLGGCANVEAPAPQASPSAATGVLPDPLPPVAARVNGHPIYTSRVQLFAEDLLKSAGKADATPPPESKDEKARRYREGLRRLIERELLVEEALTRDITADDRTVERAYDSLRQVHRSEQDWRQFLAKQGFDVQSFRSELRLRYTVEALTREEFSRLPDITDAEAVAFYESNPQRFDTGERYRASHIFLRVTDAGSRRLLRTQAQEILARLKRGEPFAKLAKELSQDTATAQNGGELPVFARSAAAAPIGDAVAALSPGQVSSVVETGDGLYILELHEKLPSKHMELSEVLADLKAQLRKQRDAQALEAFVAHLSSKARIETFL